MTADQVLFLTAYKRIEMLLIQFDKKVFLIVLMLCDECVMQRIGIIGKISVIECKMLSKMFCMSLCCIFDVFISNLLKHQPPFLSHP